MDDNFDIPDGSLNSDIEGFVDNEFDDDHGNLLPNPNMGTDDNEEVTLASVEIEEPPTAEMNTARGRPRNTRVKGYQWSSESSDIRCTLIWVIAYHAMWHMPCGMTESTFGRYHNVQHQM